MTALTLLPTTARGWLLDKLVTRSARFCAAVLLAGQFVFAVYIVAYYGRSALDGRYSAWTKGLTKGIGYIPGATAHNAVVALHLMFPALMIVLGAIQLLPAVRRRVPALHRWSGRVYLVAALAIAFSGATMMGFGPGTGGPIQHLAMGIDVALIAAFAAPAWRHARARRFDAHRRWALRLFVALNAAWFFRVGLMAWILANRGPAGFDPKTFEGPFITFLSFAQYALPLAVLELYLRGAPRRTLPARLMVAGSLGLGALTVALGTVGATMALWLPRLTH
jgi:uncharacterized membrane protein